MQVWGCYSRDCCRWAAWRYQKQPAVAARSRDIAAMFLTHSTMSAHQTHEHRLCPSRQSRRSFRLLRPQGLTMRKGREDQTPTQASGIRPRVASATQLTASGRRAQGGRSCVSSDPQIAHVAAVGTWRFSWRVLARQQCVGLQALFRLARNVPARRPFRVARRNSSSRALVISTACKPDHQAGRVKDVAEETDLARE